MQGGVAPPPGYPYPYGPYGGPPPRHRPRVFLVAAVVLAGLAVVGVLVLLYLDGGFGPPPSGGRPYLGLFGGFFLLVVLVWLGFFLLRISFWGAGARGGYGRYGGPRHGPDPAVQIARQRYARGEITREQFDQLMTDLGRRGRGPGGPLSGS